MRQLKCSKLLIHEIHSQEMMDISKLGDGHFKIKQSWLKLWHKNVLM